MKKILALSSALILMTALTGCGKGSEEESKIVSEASSAASENGNSEETSEAEKIVIDPFDEVAFRVCDPDEDTFAGYYPEKLLIEFNASDSPLGSHMSFTYSIEKATPDEIIVKAKANVNDIKDFLEETNYAVEVSEKEFSIKPSGLKTMLISADQIDDGCCDKIVKGMINELEAEFKISEDEEYSDIFDELGIDSNNPDFIEEREDKKEAFEKEKEESAGLDFKLHKLYAVIPKADQYEFLFDSDGYFSCRDSNITKDQKGNYYNRAQIRMGSAYLGYVFGLFKDNDGKYYIIQTTLKFDKGVLEEENLEYRIGEYFDDGFYSDFPDEEAALKCFEIVKKGNGLSFTEQANGDMYLAEYEFFELK